MLCVIQIQQTTLFSFRSDDSIEKTLGLFTIRSTYIKKWRCHRKLSCVTNTNGNHEHTLLGHRKLPFQALHSACVCVCAAHRGFVISLANGLVLYIVYTRMYIMAGIKILLRNDCGHSFSPPGVSNTHVCGSSGMWAGCDTYIIEESPTESVRIGY